MIGRGRGNLSARRNVLGQLLWVLLFPILAWADQDFKNVQNREDLVIIQKAVKLPGQKVLEARANIHQPIEVIGSILMDVSFYSRWLRDCSKVVLLEGNHAKACIAYMEMDMPWPLCNREIILAFTTSVDPERNQIRIRAEALKNYPYPVAGANIRITDGELSIILEKNKPFETSLTIANRFDLGGKIKPSLADLLVESMLSTSIANFRELTRFSRYNRILLCRDEFQQLMQPDNPGAAYSRNYAVTIP